ncbi:SUMF1/EgtB/PvdO family nonheme iron enzyme [Lentisphaerota bacterium WC36G]|nr:SUMF1/EgtB/PvdO family nonheme iron enzyme [Lentisphaerae bacterium WC36]
MKRILMGSLLLSLLGIQVAECLAAPKNPKMEVFLRKSGVEKGYQTEKTYKLLQKRSNIDAAITSVKHLMRKYPREYKNGRNFLKQLKELKKNGNLQKRADFEKFLKIQRQSLLIENPEINFDELLLIKTKHVILPLNYLGTHGLANSKIGEIGNLKNSVFDNQIIRYNFKNDIITPVFRPANKKFLTELELSYDSDKIMFSSLNKADDSLQVMEIDVEGKNLREISKNIHGKNIHNYNAIYLPSGEIIFSSTAPMFGVPCISGRQSVPNLYKMDKDGENIRQLTYEQDADWHPVVLEDGKVMFLRWEYVDIMHYYSRILMTMNPDGTNQRSIYGSQSLYPNSMFYARPIPGKPGQFLTVVTGHHGSYHNSSERAGELTIFDANKGSIEADGALQRVPGYGIEIEHVGMTDVYPTVSAKLLKKYPDLKENIKKLIARHGRRFKKQKYYQDKINMFYVEIYPHLRDYYPGFALDIDHLVHNQWPKFTQPYPVSDSYYFTVARLAKRDEWNLYLVDKFDNIIPIKIDEEYAFLEPIPLKKRQRPPVIPSKVDLTSKEAVVNIQDIYRGPGLKNVARGTVKKLRLFTYVYGYFRQGSHFHLGVESSWTVKRVIGEVEVEKDGSASFKIPANTTISIQPLDSEGRAIQLFRSWFVAMPGENLSCVGCHEPPNEPPLVRRTIAANKPPQNIQLHNGSNKIEGYSFNNEIQPILDAYCSECHDGTNKMIPNFRDRNIVKGKENRAEERFSRAYYDFHKYFRRPGPESDGYMFMPYEYHASTSEGVQILKKGHHGVNLDDESWRRIYTWIDLNVPFGGSWSNIYEYQKDGYTEKIAGQARELRKKYSIVAHNWENVASKPYPLKRINQRKEEHIKVVEITAKNWPFNIEQAKELQKKAGKEISKVIDIGKGGNVKMMLIPAGEFVMGSWNETKWEAPRNKVVIKKPFWISATEITNGQFRTVFPDHSSMVYDQQWKDHTRRGYEANSDEQPAVRLTWKQASEFCEVLSIKLGIKVSLPTEAQWEWAARAGSDAATYFGRVGLDFSKYANLADESIERFAVTGVNPVFNKRLRSNPIYDFIPREARFNDGEMIVSGVGHYKPNAWGLYDMIGNVAEWTSSDYERYPYNCEIANSLDLTKEKVVRGGSWRDRPRYATSSYRLSYPTYQGVYNVGFRIVMEAK